MSIQEQADAIMARAGRHDRMRAADREMYDLLRRIANHNRCMPKGIPFGTEAHNLIAKIDGDAK